MNLQIFLKHFKILTLIRKTSVLVFILVLLAFLIYPLVKLLSIPFLNTDFNLFLEKIINSESILKSIKMTLYFSVSVTLLSVIFGVFWAWLLTRTNLPFKSFFKTLTSLPYAIPPFIGAISWIYLANPSNGLLNQILHTHFFNIYSLGGLIFVETCFLYTYVFLTVSSTLELMDPSFEEAARTSGASPQQTFFKITLPLILPSVANGALLVLLAALASFGVPALIGGPAGFKVITTEIYQLQKMGTMNGLQTSILLSSLLLFVSIILILFSKLIATQKKFSIVTGKASRKSVVDLKVFKPIFLILLIIFLVISLLGPFLGVLLSATSRIQGSLSLENFTLTHFHRVLFETEEIYRAFSNSILIASSVGLLTSLLALGLGYLQTQTKFKYKSLIDLFISIPYSAPGTVIALALILSFSQNFFGLAFSIYNTIWMFIIAFTLKYLNFSFKLVTDNYKQIHFHLIEAAQTSGASFFQVLKFIWIPLLKPSLIASFFLVFVPALSELTMSLFLTGPGLETIGTLIYQMQEYSDNIGGGAAVLSTFIFIFVIVMNFIVKKISKGKYGL